MRKHSIKVNTNLKDLVDCCGTGSLKNIMNISTCSAFVAAAGGVR